MRRRAQAVAAMTCAVLAMLIAAAAASAQTPQYPVSYSALHAAADAGKSPDTGPAGVNDWSCKPSAAHPEPVVLVHGLLANQVDDWDTMGPLLADNGFCVYALTYGTDPGESYFGGLQPMEQSSQQLAAFVTKVLSATGASKVDLVGHSEGTVMPRYWMEFDGGAKLVDKYVMLTPIWHGTNLAGLGTFSSLGDTLAPGGAAGLGQAFGTLTTCGACFEFITGQPFMTKLNAAGMALPGVTYTNIMTRYDELVEPYTSGELDAPGVTNIVLQNQCATDFSEHLAVAFDPVAAQDMLNALDPAHAKAVPCTLVLPGLGAPNPPAGVGLSNSASAGSAAPATAKHAAAKHAAAQHAAAKHAAAKRTAKRAHRRRTHQRRAHRRAVARRRG